MDFNALSARVQHVLKDPVGVWDTIRNETPNPKALLTDYVLPLAAAAAIAQFIKTAVIGVSIPFMGTFRVSADSALVDSLLYIVITVLGLFIFSFVFANLAPKFLGSANQPRAFQLLAYASTASMVGGVLSLVPIVGWLLMYGFLLYGIYTFYQGITPMLEVPQEKRAVFFGTSLLCMIVIGLVLGLLMPHRQPAGFSLDTPAGKFDANDLEEASKNAEKFLKSLPQNMGN